MSFIDSIIDVGSSVWDWASGGSTSAAVARATALGYMLNQITDSINKDNDAGSSESGGPADRDYGVREQVDPDTENVIPIVYGQAFIGPKVVDAVLADNNTTMWYALVLCEQTGPLMSSGAPSKIDFLEVYWNQAKITFQTDGVTASSLVSEDGVATDTVSGLVKIYAYSGNSEKPVGIAGLPAPTQPAYAIMPGWTPAHMMNDLVFVIVRVDYDAVKDVTGLGNLEFKLRNSMKMPGDVLYDYATNTRYGAGIPPEEIND